MEISVIIPVYNKEDFVKECLLSVLSQSFNDYEVIAVDDGSTDRSGIICDEIAKENPRLKVFHVANGGVTAARRYGIEHSTGRYITFVDSDDQLLHDGLRILHDAMARTDADEVVSTHVNQYNSHATTGREGFQPCDLMIKELLSSKAKFCVLWAVLFKRGLLDGCMDTPAQIKSGEDIMMQIKCLMKTPKVFFINDSTYLYNEGVPNDRKMSLDDEMLYDKELKKVLTPMWDKYEAFFQIHQIKAYENFIYRRKFHVRREYYNRIKLLRTSEISLADKIAFLLPPCLGYWPIRLYKNHCHK